MLQTRELHACRTCLVVEEGFDLDDGRNRVTRVTEEFQAHGARVLGHAMQDPARRRDHAVAAFLLHAWQAAEEFVSDVLAQTFLPELATFDVDASRAYHT